VVSRAICAGRAQSRCDGGRHIRGISRAPSGPAGTGVPGGVGPGVEAAGAFSSAVVVADQAPAILGIFTQLLVV
jgi:hypothetical protein